MAALLRSRLPSQPVNAWVGRGFPAALHLDQERIMMLHRTRDCSGGRSR